MNILSLILAAVLIEAIIETVKLALDGGIRWEHVASILLGVIVAAVYGLDLFALAGLETPLPYVGSVLSGIIFGRGSNYVADLLSKIKPGAAAVG